MRFNQIMTRSVQTCGTSDTLDKAVHLTWDIDCGCVPIAVGEIGIAPRLRSLRLKLS